MFETLRQWISSLIERVTEFFRPRIDIEERLEEVLSWVEELEEEAEEVEAEELEEEVMEEEIAEEIGEIEEELEFLEEAIAEEEEEEEEEESEEHYLHHLEELREAMLQGEDITENALLAAELAEEDGFTELAEEFLNIAIQSEELQALLDLLEEVEDFEDIEIVWELAQDIGPDFLDLLIERIEFYPPEPYPT